MNEKIADIVEIRPSYATPYVDLGLELFDDNRNMARMTHYRPVASHRLAFEKLARALNVKDRRCYLLTGSYGTGKSHLCLMLANYVQTPAGEAPMPAFFENYVQVDPTAAEALRAKRGSGRYLVALCQWGGRGDFEEVVLRAVDEALRREGFADDFDTHYLQAIKKIEDWQALDQGNDPRGRFYADLQTALQELARAVLGLLPLFPDIAAQPAAYPFIQTLVYTRGPGDTEVTHPAGREPAQVR
jgi:hypothetical protein